MNLYRRIACALVLLCAYPAIGYAQPAPVPRNDVGQTGTISYQTGAVTLGLNADSTCSIEVAGTFVGTLQFQGAIAAGSTFALPSLPVSGTSSVTTTTTTGRWFTGCGGLSQLSVTATAWTSGKATVTLIGSMGSNFSSIGNAALSTIAQGTAAASSASWPFFLYGVGGTNQADVNASHQLLTLAAQSGSPWGMSCTPANCTIKIGDGTNTATVPAAGADATSNATPAVAAAAFNYGYNGSTWDRIRSYGTGELGVTLRLNNGNATDGFSGSSDANSAANAGIISQAYNQLFNGSTWDRMRKDTYAAGPQWHTDGGASTTAIAANAASPQVIKASAGRLARIMVTSSAAAEIDCFDNASAASGTKIGVIASGAAVGTIATFEMPAANGITCGGGATYPGYTISYW